MAETGFSSLLLAKAVEELEKIRHDCLDGSLRCGDCKAKASELMVEMFDEIHDKQDEAREIANNLI